MRLPALRVDVECAQLEAVCVVPARVARIRRPHLPLELQLAENVEEAARRLGLLASDSRSYR